MDVQSPTQPEPKASPSDEQLVRDAQRGRMHAFEELVARHRDKVYARAFSFIRNEEEAVELAQEAWIKAWQRLHQFQGESNFLTWITRIVINLCLDELRRQKRRRTESLDQMAEESGGIEKWMPVVFPNPSERLERQELRLGDQRAGREPRRRNEQAMAQMSIEQRTVLILHEYAGLEYQAIAQMVGCSLGTVMSRLFYARRRLASLLADLQPPPSA